MLSPHHASRVSFVCVSIWFWCYLNTSNTNHTDSMGIICLFFPITFCTRQSFSLNHTRLLYPLFTTQLIFSSSRQPLLLPCNFVACTSSLSSSICLPLFRVSSVEGWRARSRGLRVSPNWTEPAVSATWSSPASAVPTKRGQWASVWVWLCLTVFGCVNLPALCGRIYVWWWQDVG